MTQQEYNTMLQDVREIYIKIDLLDFLTERKLDEIQGVCIGGDINISGTSANRRTSNIQLVVKDSSFLINEDSKIWINKKIKINIGLMDILKNEIVWFNQGHYIINNPSIEYSINDYTLSFEGLDYMSLLNGTLAGNLQNITEIPLNINISTAFRSTAKDIGKIVKLNIDSHPYVTPYTIRMDATSNVYSLLEELSNLYMDYEFFFDIDGYLIFRRMKNQINDPIIWNFYNTNKVTISKTKTTNFENIKNVVQIWGRILDDGTQTQYNVKNTGNNPFNTTKLGERILTISDDQIFTIEQAQARGNYELKNHTNFNEGVSIQCVPIYSLDANQIIYIEDEKLGIRGKYLTENISIPLSYDGTMTIEAYKIYE